MLLAGSQGFTGVAVISLAAMSEPEHNAGTPAGIKMLGIKDNEVLEKVLHVQGSSTMEK